jgi:two-component system LytT family response regulator
MNALLIDDERPARIELRRLLKPFPEVTIVGEASTGMEGRELIEQWQPDLVFLDIEMPEQNGFEMLESLPPPHPHVVFTTAYNAHAIKAFEVNAIDYLLKPINPSRLAAAIAKVGQRRALAPHPAPTPEIPLVATPASPAPALGPLRPDDHVFVRDGERCWFVAVRSLRMLESSGNYTRVHFKDAAPLLYRTLNSMEERLPPELFLRANRSQIINLRMIASIGQWFSGSLKVTLEGGDEVELSRRQAQVFREQMSL